MHMHGDMPPQAAQTPRDVPRRSGAIRRFGARGPAVRLLRPRKGQGKGRSAVHGGRRLWQRPLNAITRASPSGARAGRGYA